MGNQIIMSIANPPKHDSRVKVREQEIRTVSIIGIEAGLSDLFGRDDMFEKLSWEGGRWLTTSYTFSVEEQVEDREYDINQHSIYNRKEWRFVDATTFYIGGAWKYDRIS